MIKYILANNSKSNFLSEKQIIDIINDNQKILNNNDNKKYLLNNEINIMNEIIADISLKENKINSNIEEEKELIYMLKEEKNSTNLELINLISYKETIDTVIKINIHLMIKNNSESSSNSNNNPININPPKENINSQNRNKWEEPIELYIYELSIFDSNELAQTLSDNIFSIFDINNNNIVLNDENKENENEKFRESTTFNKNFINISSFEDNNFSLNISSILPKDKSNIKQKIKNSIKNEFESFLNIKEKNDKSTKILLENIINILISKMDYLSNDSISKKNLIIYLSYFLKSLYYKNIINAKLKFINNEYKNIKKSYKENLAKLKLELEAIKKNRNLLNNRIKANKQQIELIDSKIGISNEYNISPDEENYIKICKEGNKLIEKRNKINDILSLYKDKIKIHENIINDEINKIKIELDKINKEINAINEEFEDEKIKANEKIIENRKIIEEKYKKIKNIFNSYKNKHGNNISIYNTLLNSINETLNSKNRNSNIFKSLNLNSIYQQ